jgi:hypothetical protein
MPRILARECEFLDALPIADTTTASGERRNLHLGRFLP